MGSGEGTLLTIGHALGNCSAHYPLPARFSHPPGSSSVPRLSPLLLQLQWIPCCRPQQGQGGAEQKVPDNLQQRADRGVPGEPPSENPKWKVSGKSNHC